MATTGEPLASLPASDVRIGAALRQLREVKGISLDDFSRKTGLSPNTIRKYELGVTSLSAKRLLSILYLYDTDLVDFFETKIQDAE